MLNIKVIGIGAAGNRAAIRLIESNIIPRKNIMLLNSTSKDVPDKYRDDFFYEFGNVRGCGKERELAHDMMVKALSNNEIPMEEFVDGDEKFFVIVSSTEGGTGSGSSILLGEYLQEITGAPVHMVALVGFEDDVRGLKNTVDWFNSLNNKFIVQAISNKKCLKFTNNNRKKAEIYANDIFVKRIAVLTGKYIDPSEDNMDDMDLFKLNAIPGYMSVEMINLERIKNNDQFNEIIKNMLENSVSLDTEPSVQRLGVIVNASAKTIQSIDTSYDLIKEKFGFPLELFTHTQEAAGIDDNISVVAAGLKLPIDEIKTVYTKFKRQMEKIDLSQDAFLGASNSFNTSFGKSGFDVGSFARRPTNLDQNQMKTKKSSFFSKYGIKSKDTNSQQQTTTQPPKEEHVAKTTVVIGQAFDPDNNI